LFLFQFHTLSDYTSVDTNSKDTEHCQAKLTVTGQRFGLTCYNEREVLSNFALYSKWQIQNSHDR